jgi:hypothetical protein
MNKSKYMHRIFISTFFFWLTVGCMLPTKNIPTPARNFSIEELLLDTAAFPRSWSQETPVQEWPYEVVPDAVEENRHVQFNGSNARATHSIYRFTDEKAADKGFFYPWFNDADRISSWETPEWITFNSHLADRFILECADFEGGYPVTISKLCLAVGQYGEFISVFSIWMIPPENLIKDKNVFQQALNAIEGQAEKHLAK